MAIPSKVQVIDSNGNTDLANVPEIWNAAASSPGVTDDEDAGYQVGALWVNTATQAIYVCEDATAGAAVWTVSATSAAGTVIADNYTPAQSILVAVVDKTPAAQVVAAGQFVGRPVAGNLGVITAAQARAIIKATTEALAQDILAAGVVGADRLVTSTASVGITGAQTRWSADNATYGAVPVMFELRQTVDTAGNIDIVVDQKVKIVDAWFEQAAVGNVLDSVQLFNGASAITPVINFTVTAGQIQRTTNLASPAKIVASGGTLRMTLTDGSVGAGDLKGTFHVLALPVA